MTTTPGQYSPVAASARDLVKVYGSAETEVRALDGVTVDLYTRPVHGRDGTVGLGQVDAHALPRRARHPHLR